MVKPNVQPSNATTRKILVARPPLSANGAKVIETGRKPPVKRILPGG